MKFSSVFLLFLALLCGCSSTRFLHPPFLDSQIIFEPGDYLGEWEGINLLDKSQVQISISALTDNDGNAANPPAMLAKVTVKNDDKTEKVFPVIMQTFTLGGERFLSVRAQLENEDFWKECGYSAIYSVFLLRPYFYVMQSAPFEQDLIIRFVSFFATEGENKDQLLAKDIKTADDDQRLVLNSTVEIQKALWEKKYELENFLQIRRKEAK